MPRLQQQSCLRITAQEKVEMRRKCSNRKARLPDMSGIDVMRESKDVETAVLVIIVTACGDGEVAVEALRNGARDCLEKLFSIPSHRAEWTSYLHSRRITKAKYLLRTSAQSVAR